MIQNYLDTVGSEVTSKPRNMLLSLFKKIKIINGGYLENRKKISLCTSKIFRYSDPETISELTHQEDKTIQTLKQLSKINAGRQGMEQVNLHKSKSGCT